MPTITLSQGITLTVTDDVANSMRGQLGNVIPTTPGPTPSDDPLPSSTFAAVHVVDLPWGAIGTGNVRVYTKDHGGFGHNEAVVIRFTTPNKAQSSATSLGNIAGLQYINPALSGRTSKLSDKPLDFAGAFSGADTVGAMFSVGVQVTRMGTPYPLLQPGKTYYFNVKNEDGAGRSTCAPGQQANMIFELYKPAGL
jgi:hypothetical protein